MLYGMGFIKTGPVQKQFVELQITLIQNLYQRERLPLEYVQTRDYYRITPTLIPGLILVLV